MAVGDISQVNVDFISKNSTLLASTGTTSLQIDQMVAKLVGPTEFLYYGRPDFMPTGMDKKTVHIRFQGEANKVQDITAQVNTTNTVGDDANYEFTRNPMYEFLADLHVRRTGEAFAYGGDRVSGYDLLSDCMSKLVYNISNNEHAEAHLAFNRLKKPSSSVTDLKTIAKDHFQNFVPKTTGWSDADVGGGITTTANAENKCNYGGLLRLISKSRAGFLGAGMGQSLCVQIDAQDLLEAQASSKRMVSRDFQDIKFGMKVVGQDMVFPDAFPDVKFITTANSGAIYTGAATTADRGDLSKYGKAVEEGATATNKLIRTIAFLPTGLRWFYDADQAKAISEVKMLDQQALNGTVYLSLFMNLTAHALGRYTSLYEHTTVNEDVTVVANQ